MKLPVPAKLAPQEDFHEFAIHSEEGKDREYFLNLLLAQEWEAGGETDPWDLSKDNTRVLIATERMENNRTQNLFRIWGDPSNLTFLQI